MAKKRPLKMPKKTFDIASGTVALGRGGTGVQPFVRVVLAVDSWDGNRVPTRFTRVTREEAAARPQSDFLIAYFPEEFAPEAGGL